MANEIKFADVGHEFKINARITMNTYVQIVMKS